ncbi:MAG: phosphate ABC transporter permease subunit PstC [Candidatus Marinimicrobia bacterium]|nr:phosphate ABC transporter permease subunit PstC [Candidatus Neomarinimicrobiota bacterium]
MSLTFILSCGLLSFAISSSRAKSHLINNLPLRSMPNYHGLYSLLWSQLIPLLLLLIFIVIDASVKELLIFERLPESIILIGQDEINYSVNVIRDNIRNLDVLISLDILSIESANGLYNQYFLYRTLFLSIISLLSGVIGFFAISRLNMRFDARRNVEKILRFIFFIFSTVAVLTTFGIILSLIFETLRFFSQVGFTEFMFGTHWSPQTAIREDQVGSSGSFGAIPIFTGTLLITFLAMIVAAPLGLYSAIYLSQYAKPSVRNYFKPMLEILAGIPTVVYGFFAALSVGPFIRSSGETLGLTVSTESALAAGLVMGIMIIPYVSSLSDDVMSAVPESLRDGSLALGATKSETIKKVIFPAALPGIVGAMLLAISRAIGETMIVVMAAGLAANLTANPLSAVTTVTVQIVTLLVGDQEFDSPKTLAAFALGLVLFFITLILNVIAMITVRRYRERYD